jgi:arylsulfatase A-like enzyme
MTKHATRCATWLLVIAAISATASAKIAGGQAAQVTPPPPNIVLILMDDLGYADIGSFGVPDAKTPNIDRLAREGVKLTDFYANGANCSPTRTGFITGRYQQRFSSEQPLPPTAVTG